MKQLSFFSSAVRAGFLVGILDAIAASVNSYLARGVTPAGVFRYVASGALGSDALSGDSLTALIGLGFHFGIAISWTLLFYFAAERARWIRANLILAGLSYGFFIWLMMNFVVLPLSQIPPITYRLQPTLIMIGIHMFVIGLSISFLANRYFGKLRT